MANEIQVSTRLQIKKNNTIYRSSVTAFKANLAGDKGPLPGAVDIFPSGTDIDLSGLNTYGGMIEIRNLDVTNFVTIGMYDGDTNFYPLHELLPGEQYVARLSRYYGQEFGTGTGTTTEHDNVLRMIADTDPVTVYVGAFDA